MKENMLPVIEEITGTEYSTAGLVITVILLVLITGFAGYITGKCAAVRFGGSKRKTALIFTAVSVLTMAALLCFFGASARAVRGSVMCIIMLYACLQDIKKRECDDSLSVMLCITGIAGTSVFEMFSSLAAGAGIILILLLPAVITKNGIGGGDIKFAGAAAVVLGFVNASAALIVGLLAVVVVNKIRRKQSFPLLPYLAPAFMTAFFIV